MAHKRLAIFRLCGIYLRYLLGIAKNIKNRLAFLLFECRLVLEDCVVWYEYIYWLQIFVAHLDGRCGDMSRFWFECRMSDLACYEIGDI